MKKKVHYTRGYCPLPQNDRSITLFIKLRNNFINKYICFRPLKVLQIKLGLFALILIASENLNKTLDYKNLHDHELTINILFYLILLINGTYIWLLNEWHSLRKKIQEPVVTYEENGLLHTQLWKKPIVTLVQDNLIINYKINPTIRTIIYQIISYNTVFLLLFGLISV